ncbi:TonB family protein [Humidesulfovibrio sp.]
MRFAGEERASGIGAAASLALHGLLALALALGAQAVLRHPPATDLSMGACVVRIEAAADPSPAVSPPAPPPLPEKRPALPARQQVPPLPAARPGTGPAPSPAPDATAGDQAQASAPALSAPAAPLGNPAGTQRSATLRERLVAALVGRIEQAKRYPFAARKAGIEGVVTMRVRIDEAGRIAGYSVQPDGAPHRWLQEVSLETMALVDPQLLPEGRLEAALVVEVPIRFHLR